ncbi:MAG: toxin-antitoxin system protein [Clostridia bacterium]|nr:toxin-antitoxin system protein [Clostridia bacterium]
MKPLKAKISITIDSDMLEVLKENAENDDRSLSQYINGILKKDLKKSKNIDTNENLENI